LYSATSGIVDSQSLMLSLLADFEAAGGTLALNSAIARMETAGDAIELEANDGTRLCARQVVNAAGLAAVDLANRTRGLHSRHIPAAFYAKGQYFSIPRRSPFTRLIYPVPAPGGLGIHLTLDLAGQARFGPDVHWVEDRTDCSVDAAHAENFAAEIRRYWPDLPEGALQPAYAGIRPKIAGPGDPPADFCIQGPQVHGVPGLVNLFGIESPGLTSCLAIGAMVARTLSLPVANG
jgi:L-2-hydroxyglutarate oxidase LhgO